MKETAKIELRTYRAAAVEAAAEKERQAKWAAATDAEARGALRTASKLYDDYARSYPGARLTEQATRKAKKLLADFEAKKASSIAVVPAPQTTP